MSGSAEADTRQNVDAAREFRGPETVDLSEIDRLPTLDLAALRERWRALAGGQPPGRLGRDLLVLALAQHLQEQVYGGLSATARRQLARHMRELDKSGAISQTLAPAWKPGTKLMREWRGRVHEVLVLEEGFSWNGRHYRTLSEIAVAITGTRWSGPRFFGLTDKSKPSPQSKPAMPGGTDG